MYRLRGWNLPFPAISRAALALFLITAFAGLGSAGQIAVGFISFDQSVDDPGADQFDITNLTGPDNFLPPDFPVSNAVSFGSLDLVVNFQIAPSQEFDSSSGYFTLGPDGLSYTGMDLFDTGTDMVTSATLTGTFSTTTFTIDGEPDTVLSTFTATIMPSSGDTLVAGTDLAVIYATEGTESGVPEPSSWVLMASGLLLFLLARWQWRPRLGLLVARYSVHAVRLVLGLACLFALQSASWAQVALTAWANPATGVAGLNVSYITGTGFPSGTITPANVTVSFFAQGSCGGTALATTKAEVVTKVIGSTEHVQFLIPAALPQATYAVSAAETASPAFTSTNCSLINVQHSSATLNACVPSSSLGLLSGANVTAYVPNGSWEGGVTGLEVVPIEGSGSGAVISTPSAVNSCSANSATGLVVCTANNTDVYVISGSTLTRTLTSGSNGSASFTGGSCNNCGVAFNALNNTAYIAMGLSSSNGIQALNTANNPPTFSTPFPLANAVSEDISIDPTRQLILSPGEGGVYDLLKISSTGALTEYGQSIGGTLDSAAEDCTTGIALSTDEFTSSLYITDLTQAVFTPGTPGTWTGAGQFQSFSEFGGFAAGTSGISVASGSAHLGIITGEFGGNSFAALQLPATSGTGTPAVVDYVQANMPNTPDSGTFAQGLDPHTLTAYTSPNTGKAYGVMSNGGPTWIGIIDLAALLAAPRSGAHTVSSSVNLVTSGIVRYVAVP